MLACHEDEEDEAVEHTGDEEHEEHDGHGIGELRETALSSLMYELGGDGGVLNEVEAHLQRLKPGQDIAQPAPWHDMMHV